VKRVPKPAGGRTAEIEVSEREASDLEAQARERRQWASKLRGEDSAEQQARAEQFDRDRLAAYSTADVEQAIADDRAAFLEALLAEPWIKAYVEWRTGVQVAQQVASEIGSLAAVYDPMRMVAAINGTGGDLLGELEDLVEKTSVAGRQAEMDRRYEEREAAKRG
jgi:hypothetical protein